MVAVDEWRRRQSEVLSETAEAGKAVARLYERKKLLYENILQTTSPIVRKEFEIEIEEIEKQIKSAKSVRTQLEITEEQIGAYVKRAKYLVEHPYELLLNADNMNILKQRWGFTFEEFPTYDEIVDGTPKLSLLFETCNKSKVDK